MKWKTKQNFLTLYNNCKRQYYYCVLLLLLSIIILMTITYCIVGMQSLNIIILFKFCVLIKLKMQLKNNYSLVFSFDYLLWQFETLKSESVQGTFYDIKMEYLFKINEQNRGI